MADDTLMDHDELYYEELYDTSEVDDSDSESEADSDTSVAGRQPDKIWLIQYPTRNGKICHGATNNWKICKAIDVLEHNHEKQKQKWAILSKWEVGESIDVKNRYSSKSRSLVEELASQDGGIKEIQEGLSDEQELADWCTQGLWDALDIFRKYYLDKIDDVLKSGDDSDSDNDDDLRYLDSETPDSLRSLFRNTPEDVEMQDLEGDDNANEDEEGSGMQVEDSDEEGENSDEEDAEADADEYDDDQELIDLFRQYRSPT